ncbi:MAG: glycine dehydrogenase (aminomethyl-transferring), partial [Nocardioidaceae bacterium]|nr:glycine dehydrogenase (aminomethyl-transferring) [Nocardioidaceae bacterium]
MSDRTDRPSLSTLESAAPFSRRHIGPDLGEQGHMLQALGYDTMADLLDAALPDTIRAAKALDLPPALSEVAALDRLSELAARNNPLVPMIGLGYCGTITPAVIRRNVLEDPSWYTAYTPYQPEISQGRLEALLNYQTMIADLTGLPLSNASLLDEATAAAEAMALVRRANRKNTSNRFVVDHDAMPQTIAVMRTRAETLGLTVDVRDVHSDLPSEDIAGVLIQYPGASGRLADPRPVIEAVHAAGGLAVVAADLLALTLIEAPGAMGADVVLGSSQRFGVPLFYGGPHAGYMSVAAGLERHLPGRLVGVSVDAEGRPAYRLALQTREQHIRRDKATSNICTAQVLLAVAASMYAVYHGPEGLTRIAQRVHRYATALAAALRDGGVQVEPDSFFDTLTVVATGRAEHVRKRAHELGLHLGTDGADRLRISLSELTTREHVESVLE